MEEPRLSGGCQCGAVRYTVSMTPVNVHYCHCRMCQRAVGNVFATLAPVRRSSVAWQGEPPTLFASSSMAQRGFCARCGTPLSFAYTHSEWICLTVGSFDDPSAIPPAVHYGIESQVPWLHVADDLARERTGEDERLASMTVYQHPIT